MKKIRRLSVSGGFSYLYLTILSVCAVFPLLWLLVSAFKSSTEMLANPTVIFPKEWTLENFKTVLFTLNFTVRRNLISAVIMVTIAVLTGMLTTRVKQHKAAKAESEKERMRANLLRAVSHDLRTPLTTIYSASSTLLDKREQLTDQQREHRAQNERARAAESGDEFNRVRRQPRKAFRRIVRYGHNIYRQEKTNRQKTDQRQDGL